MKNGNNVYLWVLVSVAIVAVIGTVLKHEPSVSVKWHRVAMDGSRTGVSPVVAGNVDACLGIVEGEIYKAPNGRIYEGGSIVKVAESLISVQPRMERLKTKVGFSAREMRKKAPECELSDMFADAMRAKASEVFGVPMDFALTNFGGIRSDLPGGDILLEDIESMFPFKNYLCWCTVRGEGLLRLFDQMAANEKTPFQVISGARVVLRDGKVVSSEIGGEPVDPSRLYNVATIDFLLSGGDKIAVGAVSEKVELSTVLLKDVMLDYVQSREVVDYETDGRVTVVE